MLSPARWVALLTMIFATTAAIHADQPAPPSPMSEPVRIQIRDGRNWNGFVDENTDTETLWVRIERETLTLTTGVSWDLVARVHAGDRAWPAEEFREIAHHFRSPPSKAAVSASQKGSFRYVPGLAPRVPNRADRVQWLEVHAEVGNWDRDAESDGLSLQLAPRSADGRLIPVDGVMTVQLLARRYSGSQARQPTVTLGSWSQRVRAVELSATMPHTYRLPLRASPDFDSSLVTVGMVHVRLQTFGHGVFESEAPVRLRPYNPLRESVNR